MFYQLPPVGNKIYCSNQLRGNNCLDSFFSSDIHFFNSGAASLAAAVLAVVQYSNLDQPKILLPAYTCPELVSAILYAGAKPVLVDFVEDRPWMDLEDLSAKLTEQTCAVIAVSLFGVPERLAKIRQVLKGRSISVIEDSAQAFPEKEGLAGEQGDLVVYSFGRGKPVSVLGGGAVLVRNSKFDDRVASICHDAGKNDSSRVLSYLKIAVYNRLISPQLYWLLDMLPFTQLGATIYHPLSAIKKMDQSRLKILSDNIEKYWSRGRINQDFLMEGIANIENDSVIDLGW